MLLIVQPWTGSTFHCHFIVFAHHQLRQLERRTLYGESVNHKHPSLTVRDGDQDSAMRLCYEQASTLAMPFFPAVVVFSAQWIKMSGRALFHKHTILLRRAPPLDLVALWRTQKLILPHWLLEFPQTGFSLSARRRTGQSLTSSHIQFIKETYKFSLSYPYPSLIYHISAALDQVPLALLLKCGTIPSLVPLLPFIVPSTCILTTEQKSNPDKSESCSHSLNFKDSRTVS